MASDAAQGQSGGLLHSLLHQRLQRRQEPTEQGVAERLHGLLGERQGHGGTMGEDFWKNGHQFFWWELRKNWGSEVGFTTKNGGGLPRKMGEVMNKIGIWAQWKSEITLGVILLPSHMLPKYQNVEAKVYHHIYRQKGRHCIFSFQYKRPWSSWQHELLLLSFCFDVLQGCSHDVSYRHIASHCHMRHGPSGIPTMSIFMACPMDIHQYGHWPEADASCCRTNVLTKPKDCGLSAWASGFDGLINHKMWSSCPRNYWDNGKSY